MLGPRAPLVLLAAAVLAVLHHDGWWWNDATLVGGVLPISLAWHAGFAVTCGLFFLWVGRVAWPTDPLDGEPR